MSKMLPCYGDAHPDDLFPIVLALFVNHLVHIIQPHLVTALEECRNLGGGGGKKQP